MSEDYFAHEGVNASTLKCYVEEEFSPKSAVYNAKVKVHEEKECYKKGHAVHDALEHRGKLSEKYIVSIYDSFRSNEAKQWRTDQEELGNIVLNQNEYDQVLEMSSMIWDSTPKTVREAVQNPSAKREEKIYTNHFKAMLDLISNGSIWDYKTTAQTNVRRIRNDAFKFKYHIQAFHYKMCAEMVGFSVKDFYFIFVSTVAPHEAFVFRCDEGFMLKGERDWNLAMERYVKYHNEDYKKLDGLCTEVVDLSIPSWAEEKTELDWD